MGFEPAKFINETLTHLEEEQEDGLPDGAAHLRVLERIFDFCLPEKDVSAARAPQHLLERRKPLSSDDAGDEAEVNTPGNIQTWF